MTTAILIQCCLNPWTTFAHHGEYGVPILHVVARGPGIEHALAQCIHYYNHGRIVLKLKGLSPVQYSTQPSLA